MIAAEKTRCGTPPKDGNVTRMPLPAPTLNTARLRLRPFGDADADALFALHSSATVLRYWDSPPWSDRGRAERFLATCRQMAEDGTGARLAVERDGRFIGWCGLSRWNPDHRSAVLGYCFDETAWGHGHATEAAGGLLRWAFDTLDLNRVQAEADTRNTASARVLEKLGFAREGTLRENCVIDGDVSDSWVYGLLRRQWRPPSPVRTEAFVTAGPLRLWTERTGDPGDPAVLLIAGASAQGITYPDALVDRLVDRGVQVIRYDHRDTGRSSVVDVDRHPYGLSEMAADALAVLDAYRLPSAHVAGASMGGAIAQLLAVHAPARVRCLTLLSASVMSHDPGPGRQRAIAGHPADPAELPPPDQRLLRHLAGPDGAPPGVEADVALFRVMNGDVLPFDGAAARVTLERCWARASDPSAAAHHGLVGRRKTPDLFAPLSAITAPTTVVHGDQDPVFALAHGEALAAAIPGARLHVVAGMGHVYFSPGLPERLADLIRLDPR